MGWTLAVVVDVIPEDRAFCVIGVFVFTDQGSAQFLFTFWNNFLPMLRSWVYGGINMSDGALLLVTVQIRVSKPRKQPRFLNDWSLARLASPDGQQDIRWKVATMSRVGTNLFGPYVPATA
jgi:hypothetical protein